MTEKPDVSMAVIWNDIRSYLRIAAAAPSKLTAARVFDSYEKSLAYSKMDGRTSTYKIAEATGVPQRTVADWADEFVKFNLATPPNEFFPSHRALFSLSELAIDLSALKKRKKQEQTPQQSPASTLDSEVGKGAQEVTSNG